MLPVRLLMRYLVRSYNGVQQSPAGSFRSPVQAMNAIRASQGPQEARKHAATLQRLTAATRASMEQHVRAEEQDVNSPALSVKGCWDRGASGACVRSLRVDAQCLQQSLQGWQQA